ncbi:hypothetical protein JAAARDRAFT_144999 [Jaapia argillacea MUCL 33604]|uniref:PX domain-containing protein n=1 Tax=Jaapia argillacea MUCL 33604 TaxID=933084 RepID=A0A067QP03_9AGAM|nr:hypothetical protein JAAARDRAFT_144999 [Jaapia argillacea MUCL 33604]
MFDPLNSGFGADDAIPPWPTTPHPPNSPIPNLRRSISPHPSSPQKGTDGGPSSGPFGKDPQIYGQPEPGLISPRANVAANGAKFEKAEPYLRVRISGLDRNRRDILVKFDAQTNLANFVGTTYRNVSRSYLEFQQLHESLLVSCPQTIIPALPLPQTSAPTDEEDDRLVKIMIQRWLTRICEDPIIMMDEELRSFIESDFGYQPTPRVKRKPSSGFSLIRRGVPDEDEELQRARFELTKLEGQYFDAAKAIDKLARTRRTLATAHSEMGNKLVNVAATEAHPPLGNALRKVGRVWHSLADLDNAQSISECVIVGDSLGYQGMNARSAKETLQQRTAVLEEYQAAVKTTISKRRGIERLKASSNIRPERVDEALEDLEEANKYEKILAKRADGISQNLHQSLDRHRKLVTDDITAALVEHARSTIMYERQLLRELESLRVDVSSAANKTMPKANGVPKPKVVPPLEDFAQPPPAPLPEPIRPPTIPRPESAQSQPTTRIAPGPLVGGPGPARPSSAAAVRAPAPIMRTPPLSSPPLSGRSSFSQGHLPPQSPGAGPSTPSPLQTSFAPSPMRSEPPLGGRFVDGTKSMFIKPSPSFASSPSSLSASGPPLGPVPPPSTQSPLHAPHPLAAGSASYSSFGGSDPLAGVPVNGPLNGHANPSQSDGLDPLGQAKPTFMSSSVRVTPSRPRLDPREAASKLANMF